MLPYTIGLSVNDPHRIELYETFHEKSKPSLRFGWNRTQHIAASVVITPSQAERNKYVPVGSCSYMHILDRVAATVLLTDLFQTESAYSRELMDVMEGDLAVSASGLALPLSPVQPRRWDTTGSGRRSLPPPLHCRRQSQRRISSVPENRSSTASPSRRPRNWPGRCPSRSTGTS